jgi:hypothetical protein
MINLTKYTENILADSIDDARYKIINKIRDGVYDLDLRRNAYVSDITESIKKEKQGLEK